MFITDLEQFLARINFIANLLQILETVSSLY